MIEAAPAKTPAKTDSDMRTLEESAPRFGVKISTVRTWVRIGKIKAYRFTPRCIRLREEDIVAYLAASATI